MTTNVHLTVNMADDTAADLTSHTQPDSLLALTVRTGLNAQRVYHGTVVHADTYPEGMLPESLPDFDTVETVAGLDPTLRHGTGNGPEGTYTWEDLARKLIARQQQEQRERVTYAVGLPVVVTVHTDGRVEYEIDTAEAGQALAEEGAPEWAVAATDTDHDSRMAAYRTQEA